MNRDGRGNPGRIVLKNNQPKLKLTDVLRRRRTNLASFIAELGITTYASLGIWCKRMGVSSPSPAEFEVVFPPQTHVNSPQEGVVVLEAPQVIDELSGRVIDPEAPVVPVIEVLTERQEAVIEHSSDGSKKARKKKGSPSA